MHGIGNLPRPIEGYVRNEFLHDQKSGHGSFTPCYIFAFCAIPARVPAFQIVLDNGAMWARVPLHMLTTKATAGKPLPLEELCLWDCYGYDFEAIEFELLRGATVRHLIAPERTGRYLCTIEWLGGRFAEIPDQHKNHHLIALDSGEIAAWPNNRVQWLDPSFITPVEGNPGYVANSHTWSRGQ